jgi:hypothetical protein
MSSYQFLVRKLGAASANATVIVVRAVLIATTVLLSDKGFTSFTYLQLGK